MALLFLAHAKSSRIIRRALPFDSMTFFASLFLPARSGRDEFAQIKKSWLRRARRFLSSQAMSASPRQRQIGERRYTTFGAQADGDLLAMASRSKHPSERFKDHQSMSGPVGLALLKIPVG